MKHILFILPLFFILFGCSTPKSTSIISDPQPAPTITVSANPSLILLIESTRFNTFSQLHINASLSVNYLDSITLLDNALTNVDSSAIIVRDQLKTQEPVVYQNLITQFNFLVWYSTNSDNFISGLNAIKEGICSGLSK